MSNNSYAIFSWPMGRALGTITQFDNCQHPEAQAVIVPCPYVLADNIHRCFLWHWLTMYIIAFFGVEPKERQLMCYQIICRASQGEVTDGETVFNPVCWSQEIFVNLYNDDFLWACMICASFEFEDLELSQLNDPVHHHLLCMGIMDWTGVNQHLYQVTQVI